MDSKEYLLNFINANKFMTVSQIAKYLKKSESRTYAILSELKGIGYLRYEKLLNEGQGVYYVTRKACKDLGMELYPIKKISMVTYNHNLFCTDVAVCFTKLKGHYMTERMLRRVYVKTFDEYARDINIYPDGLYTDPSGKNIAIECEIARKDKKYAIQKMDNLNLTKIKFDAVFYLFQSQSICNVYDKLVKEQGFGSYVKCYMFDDLERKIGNE